MGVLEQVLDRRAARREAAVERLEELVLLIAADDDGVPGVEELEQILVDAGWDADTLNNKVWHRRRRNECLATIRRHRELADTRPAINKTIEDAKRVLEEAKAAYQATVHPLHLRLQEITEAQRAASEARAEIRDRWMTDQEKEEAEQLRGEIKHLSRVAQELQRNLTTAKAARPQIEPNKANPWYGDEFAAWERRVQRAEQKLEDVQGPLNDAVRRSNELYANLAEE